MLNRIKLETDLCVVGGGLAGICCAVAAARRGIKVVLMHERPVLGGNASSEIRMWVCGARGENNRETGIIEEIMLENLYRNPTKNFYIWDTVLYDFIKREKNITMLLNCSCMDAKVKEGNFKYNRDIKIESICGYQMTTQQFYDVFAQYYADCSGDSILAPLCNAKFRIGREAAAEFGENTHVTKADSKVMGMSCLIQGRETDKKIKFTPPEWTTFLTEENVNNRPMNIHETEENFWYLELGGNKDTIRDTESIKEELIPLALGAWDYIKNKDNKNTENWELEFLGFLPGKRESRRMCGEYTVTQNDISQGRIFDDTIAFGGWPLDDHEPEGYYHIGTPNTDIQTPAPYTLPYRALYSKNVDNLFFAGRNISMTHAAMSSVRVMATCGVLGQAVGTAAAIAVQTSSTPHDIYVKYLSLLQNNLMDDDCFLPHFERKISILCKETDIKNGNDTLKNGKDRENSIYGGESIGIAVKNGEWLEYSFANLEKVTSIHLVFDSDLNRNTLPGDKTERYHATRANVPLDSPQMHMPLTLCKDFSVEIEDEEKNNTILNITNNRKRAYHIELNQNVKAIRLKINSNWGNADRTNVVSFDFR